MLQRRTATSDPRSMSASARGEAGFSFIEILVSIVLLGTVVLTTLVAVRATIIATRVERDHAKAQQWLQSAVQVIEDESFGDCRVGNIPQSQTDTITLYQDRVNGSAQPPFGWSGTQLRIVPPLDVWNGSAWIAYTAATDCYDDYGLKLQRITVEARSPAGEILETVQVVKGD